MIIYAKARERRIPRALMKLTGQRANPTTDANPVNTCGHHRAIVRNVTSLYGEAAYICRNCYSHLRAIEVRAVAWREVAALLSKLLPLGEIRGAWRRAYV